MSDAHMRMLPAGLQVWARPLHLMMLIQGDGLGRGARAGAGAGATVRLQRRFGHEFPSLCSSARGGRRTLSGDATLSAPLTGQPSNRLKLGVLCSAGAATFHYSPRRADRAACCGGWAERTPAWSPGAAPATGTVRLQWPQARRSVTAGRACAARGAADLAEAVGREGAESRSPRGARCKPAPAVEATGTRGASYATLRPIACAQLTHRCGAVAERRSHARTPMHFCGNRTDL